MKATSTAIPTFRACQVSIRAWGWAVCWPAEALSLMQEAGLITEGAACPAEPVELQWQRVSSRDTADLERVREPEQDLAAGGPSTFTMTTVLDSGGLLLARL